MCLVFKYVTEVYFQGVRKDLENFEKLFQRFLLKSGQSVVWSKIKSPPEGYVSQSEN